MEIIALQEYTDKYISLYEGQIRNIEDKLAEELIEKGIVAEHTDDGDKKDSSVPTIIFWSQYDQPSGVVTTKSNYTKEEILNLAKNNYKQLNAIYDYRDGTKLQLSWFESSPGMHYFYFMQPVFPQGSGIKLQVIKVIVSKYDSELWTGDMRLVEIN